MLLKGKPELVHLAGLNQLGGEHGHAVVAVGQQDAVPVKRQRFAGLVVQVNQGRVAFGEGERGRGNGAVGGQHVVVHPGNGPGGVAHAQVVAQIWRASGPKVVVAGIRSSRRAKPETRKAGAEPAPAFADLFRKAIMLTALPCRRYPYQPLRGCSRGSGRPTGPHRRAPCRPLRRRRATPQSRRWCADS